MSEGHGEVVGGGSTVDGDSSAVVSKPRKKKRSANFILEKKSSVDNCLWGVEKDGFVSPKAALDYLKKSKIEGIFRVVRLAGDEYETKMLPAEPTFELSKISKK